MISVQLFNLAILLCVITVLSVMIGFFIGFRIKDRHRNTLAQKQASYFVILKSQLDKYYVKFENPTEYRYLRRSGDGYILDSSLFATPFFSKEEAMKAAEDFIKSQQLVKV